MAKLAKPNLTKDLFIYIAPTLTFWSLRPIAYKSQISSTILHKRKNAKLQMLIF
eukprot:UN08140